MFFNKSKCWRKIKIKNNNTAVRSRDEADRWVMQLSHSCSEEGGDIKNGQNAFNIVQVLNNVVVHQATKSVVYTIANFFVAGFSSL